MASDPDKNNIKIPKNSVIIDKIDNFIYPSFIETTSSMSIKEAKRLQYSTRSAMYGPTREGFYWNDHILSDYNAFSDYSYDTKKAKELRASGFGIVNTQLKLPIRYNLNYLQVLIPGVNVQNIYVMV